MRKHMIILSVALLCMAIGACCGENGLQFVKYAPYKLRASYETPHIEYGKPMHGGPLKVFCVVDARRLRDVIELSQRMELDYVTPTIVMGGRDQVGWVPADEGWSDGISEMGNLLQGDYDSVLYNTWSQSKEWYEMTGRIDDKVASMVERGIGLVIIYQKAPSGKLGEALRLSTPVPDEHPVIEDGFLPPGIERDKIRIGKLGLGHIVFLRYPGNPFKVYDKKACDDAYGVLSRALLWTGKRQLRTKVTAIEINEEQLDIKTDGQCDKFDVVVRNEDTGEVEGRLKGDIDRKEGSVKFPLLPYGGHIVTARVLDKAGKVLNWRSLLYKVKEEALVRDLTVEECVDEGKAISCSFKVENLTDETRMEHVRVVWLDEHKRECSQREMKLTLRSRETVAGKTDIVIDKSYSGERTFNTIEVRLLNDRGKTTTCASAVFLIRPLTQNAWRPLPVIMPPGFGCGECFTKALRDMGVTMFLDKGEDYSYPGKFGLYCRWWQGLLHGGKAFRTCGANQLVNPDLTVTSMGEAVSQYAKGELQKGIGQLIAYSEKNDELAKSVVVKSGKADVQGIEIFGFKCAELEIVGLYQPPESLGINPQVATLEGMRARAVKADVSFEAKMYLYDARNGKYIGHGSSCSVDIAPGDAVVIVRSPEKLKGLDLKLDKAKYKRGDTLEIAVSRKSGASGIARLEFFDPEKKCCDVYSVNVPFENGVAKAQVFTALNDKHGKWRVIAKDILSGETAEAKFEMN